MQIFQKHTDSIKDTAMRVLIVSLLSVLTLTASHIPASDAATNTQIRQLQSEIAQVQNDSDHKNEAKGVLGIEASSLQDAISQLQGQIDSSLARIAQLEADVNTLNAQITEAEAELVRQKATLGEIIKSMYVGGEISSIELLATSNNFSDYFDKQAYRERVQDQVTTTLDKIEKLKVELDTKRKTVQATLDEQVTLKRELDGQRAEKDRILALNQDQQNQLQSQIISNSGKLAELKKKQAEAEAALTRALSSGSYRVAEVGYVSAGQAIGSVGNTGFSSGPHLHLEVRNGGGIINPNPYIRSKPIDMPPGYISQGYGEANSIYRSGYHTGIDYATYSGAIYAIDSGTLYRGCSNQMLGTSTNSYGYVAIVEHSNGTKSVYGHMSGGPSSCNFNTYY